MKQWTRFIPYVLIAVAFLFGLFINNKPDKEVERLNKKEQSILQNEIKVKEARVIELTKAGQEIALKAEQDSIRFAGRLKAQEIRITRLTKSLHELKSLDNATTAQLDSLRAVLLQSESLHTDR